VTQGALLAGKKMVLMSDGVVEARSEKGELYGFERVAPLTMKPAQEIADAAVSFGQEDDITVLTIACLA
jgi:serine phosphatase RsbU (regulator of sigma subunit)